MVGGTYDPGEHTLDVSSYDELDVEVDGVRGGGATDAYSSYHDQYYSGGSGGNGGSIHARIDVAGVDTLTLQVGDRPASPHLSGGSGGSGVSATDGSGGVGGDGGDGGGHTAVRLGDSSGTIVLAAGGGGGGGGDAGYDDNLDDLAGAGAGGGAAGGAGGTGGSSNHGGGGASGTGGAGGAGGAGEPTASSGEDGGPGGYYSDGGHVIEEYSASEGGSARSSGRVTVQVPTQPTTAPRNLSATAVSDSEISLSWDAPSGGDPPNQYHVYRATQAGVAIGTPHATVDASQTSVADTGLSDGSEYFYVATAENEAGESDPSNEVAATSDLPAPTGLAAPDTRHDEADLSWTLQSSDEQGVLVETRLAGDSTWTEAADLDPGTESHTLPGLLNGRDYEARVAAYTDDVTVYDLSGPATYGVTITDYRSA